MDRVTFLICAKVIVFCNAELHSFIIIPKYYTVNLHSANFCFSSKLPCSVDNTVAEERWKNKWNSFLIQYLAFLICTHIINYFTHNIEINKLCSTLQRIVENKVTTWTFHIIKIFPKFAMKSLTSKIGEPISWVSDLIR